VVVMMLLDDAVMEDRLGMVIEEEHRRLCWRWWLSMMTEREDAHCEEISHQFSSLSVITTFILLPPPPPPPPAPAPDAATAAVGHGMLGQVHRACHVLVGRNCILAS